ncbi:hypothetical protein COZ22_04530 [bacterium (Candidatus Howlettbacteria) CG_4_10_14_3_um_filter_37_10]|nr:MAG: hypothetical protein COX25_02175 [bacterium (Candidatus Howlettbacteria) CG23_combo_of_CG06-09_8_20_14_all_37_9]PIX98625.1 MAG: hypothetical protein COZ22_04530 [bacterium (Candidatus Howlettbacteria) CG_4_10_14_3_um_filter_37_10]PJB06828.1 MAG: hypothetical protein CO123_01300 [bacterium (Candidatus Howlettbacteria) CG_4_9_14_3_um_filter_37_10]
MNEKDFLKIFSQLKSSLKCPLCAKSYNEEDIKFMGNFLKAHLLELHCKTCDLNVMATVILNPTKHKYELTKTDFQRLDNMHEITADEMIYLHEFLKKFDGDFKKHLS